MNGTSRGGDWALLLTGLSLCRGTDNWSQVYLWDHENLAPLQQSPWCFMHNEQQSNTPQVQFNCRELAIIFKTQNKFVAKLLVYGFGPGRDQTADLHAWKAQLC